MIFLTQFDLNIFDMMVYNLSLMEYIQNFDHFYSMINVEEDFHEHYIVMYNY